MKLRKRFELWIIMDQYPEVRYQLLNKYRTYSGAVQAGNTYGNNILSWSKFKVIDKEDNGVSFFSKCTCNCHDPYYREYTDEPEHANCAECRKVLAEEDRRFRESEKWHEDFIVSVGQRPFRSVKS